MQAVRRIARWAFAALLLLLPVATIWNFAVASSHPALLIRVGLPLNGVTHHVTPEWSFAAFRDGRLQKAVATLVGEALPVRPPLIRLNNQIALSLFGELNVPDMMIGAHGQLIETGYLTEYCSRRGDQAEVLANRMIPILRHIQAYYKSRGGVFLYVITPSKAAHLPEDFVGLIDCPSTAAARINLVPDYAERIRQAGIAVFDAATFVHGLKGTYPVALFPRGGIHWNSLGVARAVREIMKAIDQQSGDDNLPLFDFDVAISNVPEGTDRDLVNLINVMAPPLDYPVPKLTYRLARACDAHPARFAAAVVGGSFMHAPTELLTRAACLSRLDLYFYLRLGRFSGVPHGRVQSDLTERDLLALRDVKLLLLEENEGTIGRSEYVDALNRILGE